MASAGVGTRTSLFGELFKLMAGVNLVYVPYRREAAADLISGQVQLFLSSDQRCSTMFGQTSCGHCRDNGNALESAAGHPGRW